MHVQAFIGFERGQGLILKFHLVVRALVDEMMPEFLVDEIDEIRSILFRHDPATQLLHRCVPGSEPCERWRWIAAGSRAWLWADYPCHQIASGRSVPGTAPLFLNTSIMGMGWPILMVLRVRLETHPDCASRRVSSMMEAA